MIAMRTAANAGLSQMMSAVKSSHSPTPCATPNNPSTAQDSPPFRLLKC
jgi:hypothetical protein